MKVLLVLVLVAIFAVGLIIQQAESGQTSLPPKLVEQMEALPAKLKAMEQEIAMGVAVNKAQYEEIDVINAKIDKLQALIVKPKVAPVVTPKTPEVVVTKTQPKLLQNGTHSQPDGYRSQWTYPGDIVTHVSTVHGIPTAGKSKEQLEREHDAAHNAVVTRSVVVQRPQVVRSNCPGGVCPTQPTKTRGWQPLIRRR
jgi:hypothetical protein